MCRLSVRARRSVIRAIIAGSVMTIGIGGSFGGLPRAMHADARGTRVVVLGRGPQPPQGNPGGQGFSSSPTSIVATAASAVVGHNALVSGSTVNGDVIQASIGAPGGLVIASGTADVTGHFTFLVPIAAQTAPGPSSIYLTDATTGMSTTISITITATGWTFDTAPPHQATAPAVTYGVDGRLYQIGGTGSSATANQIYNPTTGTWTTGAGLPANVNYTAGATLSDGSIAVLGGVDPATSNDIDAAQVYSPTTNTWTSVAPLPLAVEEAHAAGTTNGQMYVFSGLSNNQWITDVYRYDPGTKTWTAMASLPAPLYKGTVSYDGHNTIYAVSSTGPLYTYNIARNQWSTEASSPASAQYQASGVTSNGLFVTAGGSGVSDAQSFNVSTNTWTTMTPNPEILRDGGGTMTPSGTIYTVGQGRTAYIPFLETYVSTSTSPVPGGSGILPGNGASTPELGSLDLLLLGFAATGFALVRRGRRRTGARNKATLP